MNLLQACRTKFQSIHPRFYKAFEIKKGSIIKEIPVRFPKNTNLKIVKNFMKIALPNTGF